MIKICIMVIDCFYVLSVISFEFINLKTRKMEEKLTKNTYFANYFTTTAYENKKISRINCIVTCVKNRLQESQVSQGRLKRMVWTFGLCTSVRIQNIG